jgi:hypothetical protein
MMLKNCPGITDPETLSNIVFGSALGSLLPPQHPVLGIVVMLTLFHEI